MSADETAKLKKRLGELLLEKAYREGSFTLASGKTSNYYIEGKMVSLDPEGVCVIGNLILEMLEGVEYDAVGGPAIGADPIAAAVAYASFLKNPDRPVPAFIVRPKQKAHGAQRAVEGPLPEGARVVVVEDVVTTGGSLVQAIRSLEDNGCTIVKIVSLVDREAGHADELKKYDYTPIFTISELKKLSREKSS